MKLINNKFINHCILVSRKENLQKFLRMLEYLDLNIEKILSRKLTVLKRCEYNSPGLAEYKLFWKAIIKKINYVNREVTIVFMIGNLECTILYNILDNYIIFGLPERWCYNINNQFRMSKYDILSRLFFNIPKEKNSFPLDRSIRLVKHIIKELLRNQRYRYIDNIISKSKLYGKILSFMIKEPYFDNPDVIYEHYCILTNGEIFNIRLWKSINDIHHSIGFIFEPQKRKVKKIRLYSKRVDFIDYKKWITLLFKSKIKITKSRIKKRYTDEIPVKVKNFQSYRIF